MISCGMFDFWQKKEMEKILLAKRTTLKWKQNKNDNLNIDDLTNDLKNDLTKNMTNQSQDEKFQSLNIIQLQSSFYFFLLGVSIASTSLLIEIKYFLRQNIKYKLYK